MSSIHVQFRATYSGRRDFDDCICRFGKRWLQSTFDVNLPRTIENDCLHSVHVDELTVVDETLLSNAIQLAAIMKGPTQY
jgi:hypothetical protein